MIDNRALTVLAVVTVEQIEEVMGQTTIDQERVLPIVESALAEAHELGFRSALSKMVVIESEAK